jgi:RimJ/RimL family protein N-acetyltransferase
MPPLETPRLLIRPFSSSDLETIHHILDVELADADLGSEGTATLERRAEWLQWTVLNYEQLARLYQPPYGDRAVVLKSSGQLIGACGYVPSLGPFAQLATLPGARHEAGTRLSVPEFGLFFAISPGHQRRGYGAEAARALIDYAFRHLHLRRVVATTTHTNAASIGVMRKVGMRIERNPYPDPPWFQVVGVLENPG